jgi:hypothetical protein
MLHFVALCCALHFVVPGVWDTCNFMSQIEGSNATRQVKDLPVLLASDLARRGPESQTHSHIDIIDSVSSNWLAHAIPQSSSRARSTETGDGQQWTGA